jgi:tetratricopeptide (TPR) repeat protein
MGPDAEDLPDAVPGTPLEQAQQVMYDAFDARGKKRVTLARKALEISPDCADAYVVLAEETAGSAEEARDLYAAGMTAGERALGPEPFEEDKGGFWGILETRPYMRAREGLVLALQDLGEEDAALAHVLGMLELNPNDNQGVRCHAALWLVKAGRCDEAKALLRRYKGDEMLEMYWARAVLAFRTRGPGKIARRRFREAAERNPSMLAFLCGAEKPLKEYPTAVAYGSLEEGFVGAVALIPLLEDDEVCEWFFDEFSSLMADFAAGEGLESAPEDVDAG